MKRRLVSSIIVITISLFCFASCGDEHVQPSADSYVLGLHANFANFDHHSNTIYENIYDTCLNYGEISYVVVEGDPEQTSLVKIKRSDKNLSPSKEKEIAKRNTNSILESFSELKAETREVDTLKSIKLSANTLQASKISRKRMYIFDSGLCTTGFLSQVSSNVLGTDPKIIVDKLESKHALPNLKGIDIEWIGLGCVSAPQEKIPDSYLYNLQALWTTIIERAGGNVTFDTTPITGQQSEDLPNVTAVAFPSYALKIDSTDGTIKEKLPDVTPFHEDTIKFNADEETFISPNAASSALLPIAKYLKSNPNKKVLLIGTTAKVGNGDGKALSLKRTQTVMKALIKNGASSKQIQCLGLGCSNNPFRVEDHNADGTINEKMAAKNRAIYVVQADSDIAKKLKRQFG